MAVLTYREREAIQLGWEAYDLAQQIPDLNMRIALLEQKNASIKMIKDRLKQVAEGK